MKAHAAGAIAGVDVPREGQILLACARVQMSPEGAARLPGLLEDKVDWPSLLRLARRHHVESLLYRHLNETYQECVPSEVLSQLEDRYRTNLYRSTFLTGELLKLVDLFAGHGIPVVPLKGPVLAASLYGDLALREFLDLDLLVRREDTLHAKEVLVSEGYRPELPLNRAQEAAKLRTQYEYRLERDDGRVGLELQWTVAPGYFAIPLRPERFWERLGSVALGGVKVLSLSHEDLLTVLCIHGTRHQWNRLSWICDVAQLLETQRLDWDEIGRRARELHIERILALGLVLACDLLNGSVREHVARWVREDPAVLPLAQQVRRQNFAEPYVPPSLAADATFHLRARERMRDRALYCLRFASDVTMDDWASVRLPGWLFPLYYVIRPLRLLRKYGFSRLRAPRP